MLNNRTGRALPMAALLLPIASLVLGASSLQAAENSDVPFAKQVNLEKFRLTAVQNDGRFKTFDTLARSTLRRISGGEEFKQPVAGSDKSVTQDAAFTYLDLMFNPHAYDGARLLYVKETEIRKRLVQAAKGRVDEDTLNAILKDGHVSISFLGTPEVRASLDEMNRDVMRTAKKVEALVGAAEYTDPDALRQLMRVIPPADARSIQERWNSIADLRSSAPEDAMHAGMGRSRPMIGLDPASQAALSAEWAGLEKAWVAADAPAVNAALNSIADRLANIGPQVYPAQSKLSLEHWYYKHNKMMWSWVFYFFALVFLLMGVVYRWPTAVKVGAGFFAVGFLFHTAACGIRWYLAGHIPNANMFEAVTAAAWFGAAVAIFFELGPIVLRWMGSVATTFAGTLAIGGFGLWLGTLLMRGASLEAWQQWGPVPIAGMIIGAIGCMGLISLVMASRMVRYQGLMLLVGSVAGMVAMMCGQFMKNSLDSDIGRTMPILNDIWLYIHTNMIIASYALIGMAFVTAALYVVGRMLTTAFRDATGLWLSILIPTGVVPLLAPALGIPFQGIWSAWAPFLIVLGMFAVATIARLVWREGARRAYERWEGLPFGMSGVVSGGPRLASGARSMGVLSASGGGSSLDARNGQDSLAKVFDGATMLLLELSFIMLWTGIIMGAKWADHSWGRPWGWDPKEVFALNTWIIFLILVHVRLRVKDRELWTAVLAVIGASVMMFNWVVVNFFIVGLHSYA